MTKTATTVALAAALAQPALATTVYVPFADRLQAGAPQRSTELHLTNSQAKFGQSVTYRVLVDGKAATFKTVQLGPGQSRSIAPGIPMGASGLIELDIPNGVEVDARLLVERPGKSRGSISIPAFVASSAAAGGDSIVLQGLTRDGGRQSGFSIQNFDARSATCSVQLVDEAGKALGAATEVQLPGKSSRREENAFSGLTSNAIANAGARVSCDRRFWAYGLVEETATGETELVTPALELMATTATSGVTPSAAVTYSFTKSGTFLVSSDKNLNWIYIMRLPSTLTFRKVVVDYDFFVNIWDPKKSGGTHEVMWLQRKVNDWKYGMMGYINSRGSRNDMRFGTNYNTYLRASFRPGLKQKTNYHLHYEWDGINNRNFYNILQNGLVYTKAGTTAGAKTVTLTSPMVGMGGQTSCSTCPESRTPGWTFSNMVVQYIP